MASEAQGTERACSRGPRTVRIGFTPEKPMSVSVEFYGIPRQRAGVARSQCEAATLGELLHVLERQFPAFGAACLDGARLRHGYVANINGERFVGDPSTPLQPHDAVLILSADAGG